jgi:hypothetical protein
MKKSTKLSIDLRDETLAKKFRIKCITEDVSMSDVVVSYIKEWVGTFERTLEPLPEKPKREFFDLLDGEKHIE